MVGYSIDFRVIDHDPKLGIVGHAIQVVKFDDPYITEVLPYSEHDVIVGSPSRTDTPTYCLEIYKGNKVKRRYNHKKITDMDDEAALDFSKSTEGMIQVDSVKRVRDLMRNLQQRRLILRISEKCVQHMRLEHLLKMQTAQKPL